MSDKEKLTRLKAIRGGHRGVVTKHEKEAMAIVGHETLSKECIIRIQVIECLLEEKLKTLNSIDQQVLTLCAVEEIETEIEESESMIARIMNVKSLIAEKMKKPEQSNPVGTGNPQAVPTAQNVETTYNVGSTPVKPNLPKLNLPKFKGDVTAFTSFWEIFESAIHKNERLADIDKFNYLQSYLEGPAARAIQGLALTSANYNKAIEVLKQRFGRPQQIIASHMDELLKVPACCDDKPASMRLVYDRINTNIRGLESLGVMSDQYGSLLIPVIMSKLPSEIRLHIARNTTNDIWKIDDLMKAIRGEVEAREISEQVKTNNERKPYLPPNNRGASNQQRNQPGSSSALYSRVNENRPNQIRCIFCHEFHYSASCEKIKDAKERKDILRREGRCFVCLRNGHRSSDCQRTCRKCNGKHHQSICVNNNANESQNKSKPESKVNENSNNVTKPTEGFKEQSKRENKDQNVESEQFVKTTTTTDQNKSSVLLQTATAYAYNNDNSSKVKIRILFDSGSQRTYITNELKQKLSLKPLKKEILHLNTFGEKGFKRQSCEMFSLHLQGEDGELDIKLSALAFPVICSPVSVKIDVDKFPHLYGLQLADELDGDNESIDMLLGADYYYEVVTGEVVKGDSGPTAVGSKLGWLLLGSTSSTTSTYSTSNLVIDGREKTVLEESGNIELTSALKMFWDVESLGIVEKEEDTAPDILRDITFNGNRYEVGLPWKEDEKSPIPNDYELSVNRLNSLVNRLNKDPSLLHEYKAIIEEQIKSGIVEKVPINEEENVEAHFIPHHGVIRNDKDTTKLRIVFDGSAKQVKEEQSLNDRLLNGPNFIPPIFDVLVKFRSHAIGLTADIEKAFLQIEIKKSDRDKLRFLWMEDPSAREPKVQQLRFCRLVFGLKPSPSILGGTVLHHISKYQESDPEIVEVLKDLYVDDLPTGANDEETAFNIYKRSKEIMKEGGFNLRKWKSSSKVLSQRINQCEGVKETTIDNKPESSRVGESNVSEDNQTYVKSVIGPQLPDDSKTKILGVNWNVETDKLYYEFDEIQHYARMLPPTKRTVLKLVAKIFDPLGLLSAFTIKMKMMFQSLCQDKVDWDEELQGELLTQYYSLINELEHLSGTSVPRCYFSQSSKPVEFQLHGFSDASEKAFAAVVYLRTRYDNGLVDVNLVASKSRVAPIKTQTIPRLELLGATILARLVKTISTSLKASMGSLEKFHWVDSSAVLCWIKNNKCWKQYVNNRVQEIRKLSMKESWRFCPGAKNPADLPSRGISGKELKSNETWWHGPHFLQRPEEEWPSTPPACGSVDPIAMTEVVKNKSVVTHSLINQATLPTTNVSNIIDCQRFSTKRRLMRTTACVLRFVTLLKQRKNVQEVQAASQAGVSNSVELTALELRQAEEMWVRAVQGNSFKEELNYLLSKKTTPPPAYVAQFGLYLDNDSLIRCAGRIKNAPLPISSKCPVLLPKKHHFTDLVIQEVHHRMGHSGINLTLSSLRDGYWVIRGREAVKQNVRKCVLCKRSEGRPYAPQRFPDLPSIRVDDAPPFANTGLDFLGPLYVLEKGEAQSEIMTSKVYVCLYTCASTRAVHLELTPDLTAQSFLRSFRRFTSRRGVPAILISDNAKTFKSASREVRNISRSVEVQRHLANRGVEWRFIVERAPWWGGFWERLVRSVKRVLKKVIGRSKLSYDELLTILAEAESVVNARPMTYIYDDEESISYPLSPSQLIYGRRLASTPNSAHFEVVSTSSSLTRRAKHHKRILEQFINQWRREYLLSLRENSQVIAKRRNIGTVAVGDIVVMLNDKTKQQFWKLARVEELLPGQDGVVRAARVKVASSEGKPAVLQRSIQHLIPLEATQRLEAEEVKQIENKDKEPNALLPEVLPEVNSNEPTRPRRAAARVGEALRRDLIRKNLV